MKKPIVSFCCCLVFISVTIAQSTGVKQAAFNDKLKELLSFSVPIISVIDANAISKEVIFLDSREKDEINVSQIDNAVNVGYDQLDLQQLKNLDREKTYIVYCSVGYRSEKVAEKMITMGFRKVFNLYGGIFEWVNEELPITSTSGKPTNGLHCYNKSWSKWVQNEQIQKIW